MYSYNVKPDFGLTVLVLKTDSFVLHQQQLFDFFASTTVMVQKPRIQEEEAKKSEKTKLK